ncbi:unnamed protein product [Peniophora sp. CBMAI 1063]|nr:unnamed protein product [Peniophora sp. CBMAI 1063]
MKYGATICMRPISRRTGDGGERWVHRLGEDYDAVWFESPRSFVYQMDNQSLRPERALTGAQFYILASDVSIRVLRRRAAGFGFGFARPNAVCVNSPSRGATANHGCARLYV